MTARLFTPPVLGAIKWYQFNVEAFPESPMAHARLGDAYAEMGDVAAAILHLERSLELAPSNGDLRERLEELRHR